jgi:hypothetical protein
VLWEAAGRCELKLEVTRRLAPKLTPQTVRPGNQGPGPTSPDSDLQRYSPAPSDFTGGVLAVIIRLVMSVPNILPQFACIRNALSGVETSCFFIGEKSYFGQCGATELSAAATFQVDAYILQS